MTINSSANKTIVNGNGAQTQFSFSFVGVAAAYISVIFTDANGNETVLTKGSGTTQYQISLNTAVPGALWGLGGTVTYDPSGTPIPNGSSLTIFRTLPLTQAISLQNQISLNGLGDGAETGLDTLLMQLQQVNETFQRAIVAPIVDPTSPLPLPPIAQRANQLMGFDNSGNPVALSTPASGVISTAMQPVVDAASLALGRTAFGLGAIAVEGIGAGLQDDGAGNVRIQPVINEVAANQAVHAANHTNIYAASGALTFTLDRASTLFEGFSITVYALTAAVTFVPNASDNFFNQASGASLVIPKGSVAVLTTDGASAGLWLPDVSGVSPSLNVTVLSSSGTYTPDASVLSIDILAIGGGSGGGAGNQSARGGSGGATTFVGTGVALNAGGATGSSNVVFGAGGPASGGNVFNVTGSSGAPGTPSGSSLNGTGGSGAPGPLGGGGPGGNGGAGGSGPSPNSGAGGGAGGQLAAVAALAGIGGAAGGAVRHIINAPSGTSYTYSVGAGGSGATGGASGSNGAGGSAGTIIILEYRAIAA